MHRFFVKMIDEDRVGFSEAQAHQIRSVLRMQPGQCLLVLDNAGWEYEVELQQVDRKRVTAVILTKWPNTNEPIHQLTLYQSLLKRDNFEWVLQKGTEIGIIRFVPLLAERTVARSPKSLARWQRILTEAAEQSHRGRIPELAEPIPLTQALAGVPANQRALIPWAQARGKSVTDVLEGGETAVSLFIGPEGGFTETEISLAQQHGVIPVTLGKRILRAETAAITAAALVLNALGDLG